MWNHKRLCFDGQNYCFKYTYVNSGRHLNAALIFLCWLCYQPRPSARLITLTSTLIVPDVTTTEPNNCLLSRLSFYFQGAALWQRRCSYVDESLYCVTGDNRCFRDGYKPRVQPIVVPVDRSFVALFLVELTSLDWLHWRLSSPIYKNLHWAWRIQSSSEILHGQLG